MKRLAIITTHPIQYNAPLFRLLSSRGRIAVKVFYTWGQSKEKVYDARFGIERNWDVPLLEGYDYEFINNTARHPDSNRFFGVINKGLLHRLRSEGFDAVLVYRWSVWSHLLLLQRLGGRPALFFRGDSHLLHEKKGFRLFIKKSWLRFVYRCVDKAFVTGIHNKAYMLACGVTADRLVMSPHAVDNARFMADAARREEQAAEERLVAGIPPEAIVFLYAGKFYGLKEPDLLIRAFRQLKGAQYRLLLVGNGEMEEDLRELAEPDQRILFLPFRNQSEMPVVYRMGDVFVLPSKRETWGLGVNEAMACSRPALVSDHCGCAADLIREGETGFCFRSGDEQDLLQQLQQFGSREQVAEMGRQAQESIHSFSLEGIAEVMEREMEGR